MDFIYSEATPGQCQNEGTIFHYEQFKLTSILSWRQDGSNVKDTWQKDIGRHILLGASFK